jgi:hypothetical protein
MSWQDDARRAVEDKLRQINEFKERYIEAWIAETGLKPSECTIVQQTINGTIRVWLEPKSLADREIGRRFYEQVDASGNSDFPLG